MTKEWLKKTGDKGQAIVDAFKEKMKKMMMKK